MTDGLKDKHRKAIIDILSANERVERVVLFGSRAMGTFTPTSDVDIVLYGAELTPTDRSKLAAAIDELPMPQQVDLLLHKSIKKRELLDHIEKHGVEWWRRSRAMGGGWQEKRLGDYADVQTGPFGSQLHKKDYVDIGTPIITVEHLGNNRIIHSNLPRVSEKDRLRLRKYWMQRGDIVFSRVGSVDRSAYVHKQEEGWLFSGRCLRVRVKDTDLDSRFLSFFFGVESVKEHIRQIAVGATMPSLNTSLLSNVQIVVPPLSDQRAIAHILGSLDDKIELNRRMNQTLEVTARAIFKSWFVDFDPVRARRGESRFALNLPPEILDLFPDSFEDMELGEIPKGWEVKTIGQAVKCVGGATPSTKNPAFWDGGKNPFVTPKDMSSLTSPVILDTSRHITDAGVEKISSGRLPIGTVILSSRAPIGYLAITEVPVSVNQGVIAMICNKNLPNHYVLYWTETNMETIKSNAGGTTFAEISKHNFRPIQLVVPQKHVLDAFAQQVEPLHKQVVLNLQESNTLSSLRDTLLPKLISGELRVPDAEKFVKEAGV